MLFTFFRTPKVSQSYGKTKLACRNVSPTTRWDRAQSSDSKEKKNHIKSVFGLKILEKIQLNAHILWCITTSYSWVFTHIFDEKKYFSLSRSCTSTWKNNHQKSMIAWKNLKKIMNHADIYSYITAKFGDSHWKIRCLKNM